MAIRYLDEDLTEGTAIKIRYLDKSPEELSLAKQAVDVVVPPPVDIPTDTSPMGYFKRILNATKETIVPSMSSLKRLFNPNAGQFGVSRMLEEEGRRVGQAVRGSVENIEEKYPETRIIPPAVGVLNTAKLMSDGLTPSAFQQNLGAEAIGPAVGAAVRPLARGGAKLSELLTGTEAQNFRRLYDDPAAILPEALGGSQSTKKAGAILGAAEKKAGFLKGGAEGVEEVKKGLGQFEGKTSPFKGDQGLADVFYERVAKGETLTPPEMLEAYKATSRNLRKMSRKDARYVEMVKFEKALSETLEGISPEYAAAKANYARSAMGKATSNLLPRTRTGNVSQGRLGFNALLFGGGVLNPAVAATTALSSPAVHGAGYALASAAAKGISLPGVGTSGYAGLRAILQRYKERSKKEKPRAKNRSI